MVKDEMGESTEEKNEEPGFIITPVEINAGNGDQDEEKKRVAKYPAVAEGFPKEEGPHRLIYDIGQKGADE